METEIDREACVSNRFTSGQRWISYSLFRIRWSGICKCISLFLCYSTEREIRRQVAHHWTPLAPFRLSANRRKHTLYVYKYILITTIHCSSLITLFSSVNFIYTVDCCWTMNCAKNVVQDYQAQFSHTRIHYVHIEVVVHELTWHCCSR